ncbi:YjfB family protein [Cohnella zeiphila]|uniref:YjfB family protein n=1 Tax=Cohnella zeiphila TaxID=2761120 RepID=A0A7X0SM58_9BACL|nr:YjfB family protein [Cohnella zeiphila]MBB6732424.1 YjfB family protein [Cohnella zeiphila]
MDIAALSTALSQQKTAQAFGVAVLAMANDQTKQQGQNLVQMIAGSLDPNLGTRLDVRA